MSVADLVPSGGIASREHADALLELSYLVTAVDGRLDDSELDAYREVVARVRNKASVPMSDVDALLDRFAGNIEPDEIAARVRELGPSLPEDLRGIAYKLVVGLGVADLDASDDETELQAILAEALGLDQDRVDALTAEVYAALDAGSD